MNGGTTTVKLDSVVAAGYTGRDQRLVQEHVRELEEQGIAPPPHIPMLYPVMPTLVTNSDTIAVLGEDSTPEIEVAIIDLAGELYVTVASDHTDRKIEATSVPQSKNACPKIVGKRLWPLDEVLPHWDSLELSSSCAGRLLQKGTLQMLLPLDELLEFADVHAGRRHNRMILSGTVPTLEVPARQGAKIELELHDPVREQSLEHEYTVHVMKEFFH